MPYRTRRKNGNAAVGYSNADGPAESARATRKDEGLSLGSCIRSYTMWYGLTMTLRTPRYVADLCGVSLNTLKSWRHRGYGPPFIRFGPKEGTVRYRQEDLDRWLESLRAGTEAPAPSSSGPTDNHPEGE